MRENGLQAFALSALACACGASSPPGQAAADAGSDAAGGAFDAATREDAAGTDATQDAAPDPFLALPNGAPGIGFDDLRFSARLQRVIVPAGRTGQVDLVDPSTRAVTSIGGFSSAPTYDASHGVGPTSADEGEGWLFVLDKTALRVHVVDPAAGRSVASAAVASSPDYVRYVAATRELWVTEPATQRIQVFALDASSPPAPAPSAFVAVSGGPESLVVDGTRARAYTNTFAGSTIALDTRARAVVGTWKNGCAAARGVALDEPGAIVFVGCAEGALSAVDVASGALLSTVKTGAGVDIIDFAPALRHVYAPAADAAQTAIVGVSRSGQLATLGAVATPAGAHCVVADGSANAWVCDPAGGRLVVVTDVYPPTN